MFYCDECKRRKKWPGLIPTTHGKCEVCGTVTSCFNVPSNMLPLGNPNKKDETEATDG